MWEGQALPQDIKFGNCRDKIVDSRAFLSWSLILGSSWSGLIKLGPGCWMPTIQRFRHWRAGCVISALFPRSSARPLLLDKVYWPHFYQTRSAWSVDQGSNKNHSLAYMSLPHDTKFGNCRCKIVDSRAFPSWSLIHGLRWSGLIKAEPGPPL